MSLTTSTIISLLSYANGQGCYSTTVGICIEQSNSFIHSVHFYSAPSSPLLLRGAPDYSTDTVSEFHAEAHRELQVKDLPKVPTWRLEQESNPRPSGWTKAPPHPTNIWVALLDRGLCGNWCFLVQAVLNLDGYLLIGLCLLAWAFLFTGDFSSYLSIACLMINV